MQTQRASELTRSDRAIRAPGEWDNADKAIVRLPPSAFPDLPQAVREDAERRGCTIPQLAYPKEPHNVIEGEFTRSKQLDWAILCSRNRVSSILVYRGGTADDVAELAASEDRHYLQGSRTAIYFSHQIGVATPEYIHAMNKAFDGGSLPPIDHDGINDAFVEKASSIKYWHQGKWWALQGAD
jgi:hypothetical protein